MSYRFDANPLISGAYMWGNRGIGIPAENIPENGEAGPSVLFNDVSLPADNGKEIRWVIEVWPTAGTFIPYEDGSFSFTDAPDGSYTAVYREYEDGVDKGTATIYLNVGGGLIVDAIAQGQSIGIVALTVTGSVVSPDALTQSQSLSLPIVVQHNVLSVDSVSQSQSLAEPLITQAHILTVDSINQAQSLSQISLLVAGSLAVNGISQSQAINQAALTQHYALVVDNIMQSQVLGEVTLNAGQSLSVFGISQSQAIGSMSLVEHGILTVDSLTQVQVIDVVSFGGAIIGFLEGEIVICSAIDGQVTINKLMS